MIKKTFDDLIKLIRPFFLFLPIGAAGALQTGESAALYRENFDEQRETAWGTLPQGWWLEGESRGARARIHEGRLWIDAIGPKIPGATVWLDRVFSGDVEVSFDVHVVSAKANANNMNFFFMYRDPSNPDLRSSAAERTDGLYSHYHSGRLRGTILTFLANNGNPEEARVRVRQVPPFDPVVKEFVGYHAQTGRTYRVTIARRGLRFTCKIDGHPVIDVNYPRPAEAGLPGSIGFRTWQTELWWDNIVVRRPTADHAEDSGH